MTRTPNNQLLARAIIASQIAPPIMFSGVAVALPTMGTELRAGAVTLGLVETLFLAGNLAFLLPVGRLADASDKNTLYKLGLLGFGLASALIGLLSSTPAILALRFAQGICSAVVSVTGPAILADIVPPERRGRAFGSAIGVVYAGLTLGPICAGFMVDHWGWRAVFELGAALLLLGSLLVHSLLSSSWRRSPGAVHLPSTLLVVSALLCLVFGASLLKTGAPGVGLLGAGLALAVVFVVVQRRVGRPLIDIGALMAQRVLRNALLAQMLLYMNAFASIFMLSIYMQVSLGRSAKTSGQVLAISSVLMAITAPLAGRLADRFPPRRIAAVGTVGVLATSLMGTLLHADSSLGFVTLMLASQGLGFALFSSPNMTLIMNSGPAGSMSTTSALGAKSRSLGMVSGMLVTALLISLNIGNDPVHDHPLEFVETITETFTVLSVSAALALAVGLFARSRGPLARAV